MSDWAKIIQESFDRKADVIPAGWKTVKEIADDQGVSKEHMSRLVTKLVRSGKVEMKKFRTIVRSTETNNIRRRAYFRLHPYYRIIEKKR